MAGLLSVAASLPLLLLLPASAALVVVFGVMLFSPPWLASPPFPSKAGLVALFVMFVRAAVVVMVVESWYQAVAGK